MNCSCGKVARFTTQVARVIYDKHERRSVKRDVCHQCHLCREKTMDHVARNFPLFVTDLCFSSLHYPR